MKVSGFTFVRNAVKYDYPIVESIQSILPLVDEEIAAHKAWLETLQNGFNYNNHVDSLSFFNGTHPQVMLELVSKVDWHFEFDVTKKKFRGIKKQLLYYIEKTTGKRLFEYRNYKQV